MKTYYTVILSNLFRGEEVPVPIEVCLNCGCKAFDDKDWVKDVACERIFAGLNRGSNQEFPAFLNAPLRSMCVGDYIYDHQLKAWFKCKGVGFGEEKCPEIIEGLTKYLPNRVELTKGPFFTP